MRKIAIIGLGYVGMPLAVAFSKKYEVTGFDICTEKIAKYKQGIDVTAEVGSDELAKTKVKFTDDELDLDDIEFFIVAVPTPINQDKTPDLSPVIGASEIVGHHLRKGCIVVYESTVYPGVTEDVCLPILEKQSGLIGGVDFKIGYSPERINPGDKVHRLNNIKKIVSGMDNEALDQITGVYESIIEVGVHRAPSIKVAEAAKVVENSQRDINIAFMNELAMVFEKMGICTLDVVEAMQTKWNALPFRPGLVGGHCIGVDPYYFVYQAEKLGYHSPVIMAGRKINDGMGGFVADIAIKKMVLAGKIINGAKVGILGITFKENCPDVRNTKVIDIISRLKEYNINIQVVDSWADKDDVKNYYGIDVVDIDELKDLDCLIVAVAHDCFKNMSLNNICSLVFKKEQSISDKIVIDVKGIFNSEQKQKRICSYWSL